MTPEFWAGKRVLVIGHTGFKGSWLSLWLDSVGAEVFGYSLPPPTTPSMYELLDVGERVSSVEADVRDLPLVQSEMARIRPEVVIHMAAQSLVRESYAEPVGTYSTNIMGTVNVLEAVRQAAGVRVALVVTSDKCYENRGCIRGYREDDPIGGDDPYSSSKGCAELVTAAYRRSYFGEAGTGEAIALASVRAGNVIGGGDWAKDRLVPDLVSSFMKHHSVSIRCPDAIRPWQHVLEPLGGYLALIEHLWHEPSRYAGEWNFGPDERDARPVGWIADQLAAHWGGGAQWHSDGGRHPPEAATLRLDCSKARNLLRWRPLLPLDVALLWTIEWYRAYRNGQDLERFTMEQITRYQKGTIECRN